MLRETVAHTPREGRPFAVGPFVFLGLVIVLCACKESPKCLKSALTREDLTLCMSHAEKMVLPSLAFERCVKAKRNALCTEWSK